MIQELSIVRAGDLSKYGVHPGVLKRAARRGLVVWTSVGEFTLARI